MSRLRQLLGLPEDTPNPIVSMIAFYLIHLFCQGWVLSSELAVLGTLVSAIIALYRRDLRPSFHILYYPFLIYGIASTVSAIAAPERMHAGYEGALWGKMLLFPMVVILFRNVPRSRVLALRMMLVFGAFISAFGLFQYLALSRRDLEHRITGPASHVMTFSGLIAPVALMFLVLWLQEPKRWTLAAGTLLTTVAMWMTFTRSAWIGWLAAVCVLLIAKRPRLLIYAVPLFVLFVDFMPLSLFGRVMSTFDTKQSSNLDRIRMLQGGIEIIKDYPVLGVGPANVKEVYPLYRRHDAPRFRIPHLHNNIVQLWAERGILGLCAYLLLLSLFVRECVRGWRGPASRFAEIGVAVIVCLTVAGLWEFNFGDTEVFFLLMDVCALVAVSLEANEPVGGGVPVRVTSGP